MSTQAGLERCPEHDTPLHDGRCDRCEYQIPAGARELGIERVGKLRELVKRAKNPNDTRLAPKRDSGSVEVVTADPTSGNAHEVVTRDPTVEDV